VPVAMSSRRARWPYQPSRLTRRQGVRRLRSRSARLGSRAPVSGGRPRLRGWRGGGGSHRQASRRRRVTTVRCGARSRSRAMAEKLLSVTATTRRPGSQRAIWGSTWRAQSVSLLCRWPCLAA
jgi:hypothetical protein